MDLKQRFEAFLETAASPHTRNDAELKELYVIAGHKVIRCESAECKAKMLNEVRKYYHTKFNEITNPAPARKYLLKPGNHAFAPGEHSVHNNDNTTDEQLAEILTLYPHVKYNLQD